MNPERHSINPQFTQLRQLLDGVAKNAFNGTFVQKDTKFGIVSIVDESSRQEGHLIKVQVQSPEPRNDWTTFMISPEGIVSSNAIYSGPDDETSTPGEPKFTVEEVLAEIESTK